MSFLTHTQLKLIFEISHAGDSSMGMTFGDSDTFENFEQDRFEYETTIQFPTSLVIETFGKGHNDTVMDHDGNIISDKYIKLLDIQLNGLSCDSYYINDGIWIKANDGRVANSNYWGMNGKVTLDFLEENSFYWLLNSFNQAKRIRK